MYNYKDILKKIFIKFYSIIINNYMSPEEYLKFFQIKIDIFD